MQICFVTEDNQVNVFNYDVLRDRKCDNYVPAILVLLLSLLIFFFAYLRMSTHAAVPLEFVTLHVIHNFRATVLHHSE